jgi:hypothetical protein
MNWIIRIIALCIIGAALALLPYTEKFPGSAADFPQLVLVVIVVLCVLMFARSLVPSPVLTNAGDGDGDFSRIVRPVSAFAATAVAVFAMRYIGFYPAVAGLGVLLIGILGAKKPAMFTGAYAVLLVFVFLVFQLLLKVPLDSTRLWGG